MPFRQVGREGVPHARADEVGRLAQADAAPPRAVTPEASALIARDWSAALALRLNDNGDPMPLEP